MSRVVLAAIIVISIAGVFLGIARDREERTIRRTVEDASVHRQEYKVVPSRKACRTKEQINGKYCQLLYAAHSSDDLTTGDLAARTYDAYHEIGGGELLRG